MSKRPTVKSPAPEEARTLRVERALRVLEDLRAALLATVPAVPPPVKKPVSGCYVAGGNMNHITHTISYKDSPKVRRRA